MLEKFSSAEELEKSYQNLEKEFTKKCQELSRVRKELDEITMVKDLGVAEDVCEEILDEAASGVVEAVKEVESENSVVEAVGDVANIIEEDIKEVEQKIDFGLDFRAKAGEFLKNNADAKEFSREISKLLLKDKSLLNCSDPFMVAYAMVLKDKAKSDDGAKSVKEEIKVVPASENTEIFNPVPLISKQMLGASPAKIKPKFKSLEDARDELMNRYFG